MLKNASHSTRGLDKGHAANMGMESNLLPEVTLAEQVKAEQALIQDWIIYLSSYEKLVGLC